MCAPLKTFRCASQTRPHRRAPLFSRLSGESDAFAALGVITLTACLLGLARLASLADGASIEIFATLGATIVLGAGGALLLGAHEAASIALRQAGRVYVVDGYD